MPTNRAFRWTFGIAVGVGVIEWALPLAVMETTMYAGIWIGYGLLLLFGFLAVMDGHRYRYVFVRTWAFVSFWFALGVLSFVLGRGEVPADWSPEEDRLAFLGYGIATLMILPVAFASSGLGVGLAHLVSKFRHHDPPPAA